MFSESKRMQIPFLDIHQKWFCRICLNVVYLTKKKYLQNTLVVISKDKFTGKQTDKQANKKSIKCTLTSPHF